MMVSFPFHSNSREDVLTHTTVTYITFNFQIPNISAGNSKLVHTVAVRFQENEWNYPKPHDTRLETDATLHLPHSIGQSKFKG